MVQNRHTTLYAKKQRFETLLDELVADPLRLAAIPELEGLAEDLDCTHELLTKLNDVLSRIERNDLVAELAAEIGLIYAHQGRDDYATAYYYYAINRIHFHNRSLKYLSEVHRRNGDYEALLELFKARLDRAVDLEEIHELETDIANIRTTLERRR